MPSLTTDATESKIREMWTWYQQQRAARPRRFGAMLPPGTYVAKTGGTAITAASGSTPGSGTVTIQDSRDVLDASDLTNYSDAGSNTYTVTAYNFVETASQTNAFVFVVQDAFGVWWLVAEACP